MNFNKRLNLFRKKITKFVFVNNSKLSFSREKKLHTPNTIPKILLIRPNQRLGNQLLITPLLQEVLTVFPNAKIDLFLKGQIGKTVFQNYKEIDTIIALPLLHFEDLVNYIQCFRALRKKKYDLIVNTVSYSSSGTIATKIARSRFKIYGRTNSKDFPHYEDYLHNGKRPVYDFWDGLKSFGIETNSTEIPKLDIKLDVSEIEEGKQKLMEIVNNEKNTICIFTFATNEKMYSKDWWFDCYCHLKETFKEYNIIEILPFENVSQIDFIAPSFYSTNIREIAALIANTSLFIGADSGIMHLSCATNTTTIGLFTVTKHTLYQPFSNKNFGIDTNNTKMEEIIKLIQQVL